MLNDTEEEYGKLFKKHNFWDYWRPSYDKYLTPIEDIIDEIRE